MCVCFEVTGLGKLVLLSVAALQKGKWKTNHSQL